MEPQSAAERAYRQILEDILEGSHQPGEMLAESALASDLGMSRTPVRAALARLQDEDWITIYPKRGALVRGLDDARVAQLADARFVLETTAVDRAGDARRRELADRQDELVAAQRAACTEADMRRFISLTLRFHRGFVEAGGNDVLLELYGRMTDRHRFVLFAAGERLLARCEEIIDEHEALVAHLRSGDVAAFAEVLRAHIAESFPAGAPRYGQPSPAMSNGAVTG